MAAQEPRAVLVTRSTRLEDLVRRYNTLDQARFYVEHLGADFGDYEAEHRRYQASVQAVAAALEPVARVQRVERGFLPNYLFPPDAVVVVVGQDGLVANTLKYLQGQAVVGVNPDPARWEGVLLPFLPGDVGTVVREVAAGRRVRREIRFARVRLADGQELLAVNDLFIGASSHVSARYEISVGGRTEAQSSSGIVVSTGLGSTGWLRSLLSGARGITGTSGEALDDLREHGFAWGAKRLVFTVREPFPSTHSAAGIVFGDVLPGQPLRVRSAMGGNGVIFSDGVEADFLEFNAGMEATIDLAERSGSLVV